MANIISIPDSFFKEAAAAVLDIRKRSEPNASAGDIEKILRAYVNLGANKKINDWSYTLVEAERSDIADKVAANARSLYGLNTNGGIVYVDLDIMEVQAANGLLAPNVARPREAQTRYEASLATGRDLTTVSANVENVFSSIKKSAAAAAAGLGINVPLYLGIGAAALVAIILLTRGGRR